MTTAVMPTTKFTAASLTDLLAAGTPDTFTISRDTAAGYLMPMLSIGLPLLPLAPNDKCPYSAFAPFGVYSATASADDWNRTLDALYQDFLAGDPAAGVGLRLGVRIIVLDADTPPEVVALQEWLPTVGYPADTPPTVETPGTVDADGNPLHHGGGHWYIVLPEDVDLTDVPGTIKVGGGDHPAALMTAGYVVLPPTHRNNGRYTVTGAVLDATPALLDFLRAEAAQEAEKRTAANRKRDTRSGRSPEEQEQLDDWRDATSWGDVLEPHGWTLSDMSDGCGCEKWIRAGSDKYSAVTHDCARGTYFHMYSSGDDTIDAEESLSKEMLAARLSDMEFSDFMRDEVGIAPKAPVTPGLDLAARMATLGENVPFPDPTEYDRVAFPAGHPNHPELLRAIFDFDDITRTIFTTARNHPVYVPPMTVLMRSLIDAGRTAGPHARTAVADDPLNMFTVAVARSGGSKSAARKVHVTLPRTAGFQSNLAVNGHMGLQVPGVASGQAINDGLMEEKIITPDGDGKPEKKRVMRDHPVLLLDVDEMKDLLIKCAQPGSIMQTTLLTGWSGDPVGDLSRGHGAALTTGPYALYVTGAVQPSNAVGLANADAVGSGLAQRLLFTCSEDPWATAPGEPEAWTMSDMDGVKFPPVPVGPKNPIKLPEAAWKITSEMYTATAHGTIPEGDTHLHRLRCRLACLAALQRGVSEVSPELWEWTDYVMEHRRRTWEFTVCAAVAAEQDAATTAETVRARARAGAAEAVGDDIARAAARVIQLLPPEGVTLGVLKQKAGRTVRDSVGTAVAQLERAGKVTTTQTAWGGLLVAPAAG